MILEHSTRFGFIEGAVFGAGITLITLGILWSCRYRVQQKIVSAKLKIVGFDQPLPKEFIDKYRDL